MSNNLSNKFNNNFVNILVLTLLLLIFALPGLGTLEFLRHTEADRVLISQEMVETNQYIVPHLLSQPILTKPPIYYWASALSFKLLGDYSEYESRIVSVFGSVLLLIFHYLASVYSGFTKKYSLCSALVLSTTASFFILSTVAEMDMLYAAFCGASIYLVYFSIEQKSLGLTLLSYLFAAIAFLTKGPPIVVFFALSSLVYFFTSAKDYKLKTYLLNNVLGVLFFLILISSWFIPFINQIGLENLKAQFEEEILGRAFGKPRLTRGVFFYFKTVFVASCPWVVFIFFFIKSRVKLSDVKVFNNSFIKFCILSFVASFIFLSLAKGKTSRYIFPIHTFFIQALFFLIFSLKDIFLKNNSFTYYKWISSLFFLIVLLSALYFKANFLYILPSLIALALTFHFSRGKKLVLVLSSFILCLLSVHLLAREIYYPLRNQKKSVKPVVSEIINLTNSSNIYSASMYERWIQYYLKRGGIKVVQLQGPRKIKPQEKRINWLITDKDEEDLLTLVKADTSSNLIKEFKLRKTSMFLYNTKTAKALEMIENIKQNRKHEGTY